MPTVKEKIKNVIPQKLLKACFKANSVLHYQLLKIRKSRCNAPFTSIYFEIDGRAHACCENTTDSYGFYPFNSLNQMWFGRPMKDFREKIKQKNLAPGCKLCRFYLENKMPLKMKARYYDTLKKQKYPSQIEFRLANDCNLQCFMCDEISSSMVRKNVAKLAPIKNPYDDEFVRQLGEYIPHLTRAHFVGGEPFTIDIYYKIWEQIIGMNPDCLIIVQTNASLLNKRIKDLLERGRFSLNLSVDTLDKDLYEKIRVNANYEITMRNIEYFIAYCKQKNTALSITACPMQQNWHTLPDLVRFANHHQVHIFFHTVFFPLHASWFGLSVEELQHIKQVLAREFIQNSNSIETENNNACVSLLKQIDSLYSCESQRNIHCNKHQHDAK